MWKIPGSRDYASAVVVTLLAVCGAIAPAQLQAQNNPSSSALSVAMRTEYIPVILNIFQQNMSYPKEANSYNIKGIVRIFFIVNKDGRIIEAKVHSGSGSPVLDNTALIAVRTAKLPKPPDGQFQAVLPVRFQANYFQEEE